MKLKLTVILITTLSGPLYAQTRNYNQELCNLLYGKRMEEAQHYYYEYKDSIVHPFAVDSYRLLSNMYTDKPDSVLLQLPVFIGNHYGSVANDNLLLFLPTFYQDRGEYDSGLKMLDIIEAFFNRQQSGKPGNEKSLKEVEKLKKRYKVMSDFPKPEIKISDSIEMIHVSIQTEPLITFEAKYNQTVLKTVFDTGVTYPFFTQKKNVEKAGIRLIEPYSENIINEKETSSAYGIIDSVRIGSLLLKNMPVLVIENGYFDNCIPDDSVVNGKEKLAALDSMANLMGIIMGLPVIKMLNHIRLDLQDNDMAISFNHAKDGKENSNMYIESDRLYLHTEMNSLDFTAFMDTGGNFGDISMIIGNRFYRNHTEQLPSTPSATKEINGQCWVTGKDRFTFFKPDTLNMQLGNCIVDLANETAILTDDSQFSFLSKDGFIGLGLLKKLKRISFDFNAMQMNYE
jgi:hypothetical protein